MGGRTHPVLKSIEISIAGQSLGPFDFFEYTSLGALDANRNPRVGYAKPFQTGGVVGLNFLLQHRARFDFPAQTLFLSSGKGLSGVGPARFEGFTAVPIQITSTGRIEVCGLVDSRRYSFLVDTGSQRSVIDWKIKETNQIPVRFGGTLYFAFIDRTVLEATGNLQNFKIGTLDVSKKFVQFARSNCLAARVQPPFRRDYRRRPSLGSPGNPRYWRTHPVLKVEFTVSGWALGGAFCLRVSRGHQFCYLLFADSSLQRSNVKE